MKKYLIIGTIAISLMATTVYALNTSNDKKTLVSETTPNYHNCPYNNYTKENCPYYDETTDTHNCPNRENHNCQNRYNNNKHGYGRHNNNRCSHHQ